jgi:2-polyprenyl-3-methyl-5-hydroxy-6-metoxy-1,4-benzoquinol methylase
MQNQQIFDKAANAWVLNRELPWNRMRYELTNHFIRQNITTKTSRILNIGCGDGIESFLFDNRSIELTLTDCSEKMLDKAKELAKQKNISNKIIFIHSDVQSLDEKLYGEYDLIIYHNVLEYIDKPGETISQIAKWLTTDGILSVRHLNRNSNVFAPAIFENDLNLAKEYLHSPQYNSSFNTKLYSYTGEEIISFIQSAGFKNIKRYGIMNLCNMIANNESDI